eukprot:scaffold35947_cov63-Phaeocystis_antarctica.AAC.2
MQLASFNQAGLLLASSATRSCRGRERGALCTALGSALCSAPCSRARHLASASWDATPTGWRGRFTVSVRLFLGLVGLICSHVTPLRSEAGADADASGPAIRASHALRLKQQLALPSWLVSMAGGCSLRGGPLTSVAVSCCATVSSVSCSGPSVPPPMLVCAPSACAPLCWNRLSPPARRAGAVLGRLPRVPRRRGVPACHLDRILPRHPPLHHLRQLVTGLLLVPKAVLDEGAMSCGCGEQLSRTGLPNALHSSAHLRVYADGSMLSAAAVRGGGAWLLGQAATAQLLPTCCR